MLKAIIASLTFDIRQLEFPYKIMIGFGFGSFGFWFCEILISFGFGMGFGPKIKFCFGFGFGFGQKIEFCGSTRKFHLNLFTMPDDGWKRMLPPLLNSKDDIGL
jgi:hypothetical protein